MNLRKMVPLAALVAACLPATAGAHVTTGSVDATNKTATFTGSITEPTSLYEFAVWFNEDTQVAGQNSCMEPYCAEHALTVGPGGAELRLDATSDAYSFDLELVDPSGAITHLGDPAADPAINELHATLDAVPGTWTIRGYGTPEVDSFDYSAKFTFRTPEDVASDPPVEDDGE
jgi:hypothetical protein